MRWTLAAFLIVAACHAGELAALPEGKPARAATEGVTVTLKVLDRLSALRVLPEKGTFLQLTLAARLRTLFTFTPDEAKTLKLADKNDRLVWDSAADTGREFQLSAGEYEMLRAALRKLDDSGALTPDDVGLYRAIVR